MKTIAILSLVGGLVPVAVGEAFPAAMPKPFPNAFSYARAMPQSGCYSGEVACGDFCIPSTDNCCSDLQGGCRKSPPPSIPIGPVQTQHDP
jgi:hypothetical protein